MSRSRRIVCIGGWGSTNDAWSLLARALPGVPFDPLPWWECLDADGGALARALSGPPPALLLGWSLGGLLAIRALLDGAAPGVPACVLSATARMTGEGEYPGADARALRAMRMRLSRDAAGVMTDFAALCEAPAPPDGFAARFVARSRAVPPGKLGEGLDFLARADLRDRLPALRSPLLWLHGEADAVIPAASARHAAACSPHVALELVAGAGHALPATHPGLVADRIGKLLG